MLQTLFVRLNVSTQLDYVQHWDLNIIKSTAAYFITKSLYLLGALITLVLVCCMCDEKTLSLVESLLDLQVFYTTAAS